MLKGSVEASPSGGPGVSGSVYGGCRDVERAKGELRQHSEVAVALEGGDGRGYPPDTPCDSK